MLEVRWSNGLVVAGFPILMDPRRSVDEAIVTHAHSDHIAAHRRVICTEMTARLMRLRVRGGREFEEVEYGTGIERDGWRVTFHPAGHVPGSAMVLLEGGGGSLLYTGDFKLRHGLACLPAQPPQAEVLVMETTFGLPRYVMPSSSEVAGMMRRFCERAWEQGRCPILAGYPLGKAQEIVRILQQLGWVPLLDRHVLKTTEVIIAGDPAFPRRFEGLPEGWRNGEGLAGRVIVGTPALARALRGRGFTVAMVSGWGMDAGARFRYGVDEVIPLSDHADYPDLVRLVEIVSPRRVLTWHGFSREFAADLRRRGVEAWSLAGGDQLEFGW
jgi:Cft2 family RNA processing exonuclease